MLVDIDPIKEQVVKKYQKIIGGCWLDDLKVIRVMKDRSSWIYLTILIGAINVGPPCS